MKKYLLLILMILCVNGVAMGATFEQGDPTKDPNDGGLQNGSGITFPINNETSPKNAGGNTGTLLDPKLQTPLGEINTEIKGSNLASTCQTYDDIQADTTGNNPAATLTKVFLRGMAKLQEKFNAKIANASIGLGLILLALFSLFYIMRLLFPFTPFGQIAETYNKLFNLWGVGLVVFLIILNPNFIPNNIVYPIFKSLINANYSLMNISSTMVNGIGDKKTTPPDASCLGKSNKNEDDLEQIIRGIIEQTTYAQRISMANLCVSLSSIGYADPKDGDKCFQKSKENASTAKLCSDEEIAKGYANAQLCNLQTAGNAVTAAAGGVWWLVKATFGFGIGVAKTLFFGADSIQDKMAKAVLMMIFGFGLFMAALYKYMIIGLYMLEAAMLPFILSSFWSLIAVIGIIPSGRGVAKIAFFAVLQGGATIIFLGVAISIFSAIDSYIWYQFLSDAEEVSKTMIRQNVQYQPLFWLIGITTFCGIKALKQARSMAEALFKTGLDINFADGMFDTIKKTLYFVADIAGDFATGGTFSRVRKVVLK